MSPLRGAEPPKETATADRGEVIFHTGTSDRSMKKLERNSGSLQTDTSYDQQVEIPKELFSGVCTCALLLSPTLAAALAWVRHGAR